MSDLPGSSETKLGLRLFRAFNDLSTDQKLIVIDLAESLGNKGWEDIAPKAERQPRQQTSSDG